MPYSGLTDSLPQSGLAVSMPRQWSYSTPATRSGQAAAVPHSGFTDNTPPPRSIVSMPRLWSCSMPATHSEWFQGHYAAQRTYRRHPARAVVLSACHEGDPATCLPPPVVLRPSCHTVVLQTTGRHCGLMVNHATKVVLQCACHSQWSYGRHATRWSHRRQTATAVLQTACHERGLKPARRSSGLAEVFPHSKLTGDMPPSGLTVSVPAVVPHGGFIDNLPPMRSYG